MTSIDTAATLAHLRAEQTQAEARVQYYRGTPYPAMIAIHDDRAYSWRLLAEAVERGLLSHLDAENRCPRHDTIRDGYGFCDRCENSTAGLATMAPAGAIDSEAPFAEQRAQLADSDVLQRAHDTAMAAMRAAVAPRRDDEPLADWERELLAAAVDATPESEAVAWQCAIGESEFNAAEDEWLAQQQADDGGALNDRGRDYAEENAVRREIEREGLAELVDEQAELLALDGADGGAL